MIVELGDDKEFRRAKSGAPATDGSGNIIAGGMKFDYYKVTLHVFHMAEQEYAEDAQADVDVLIEQIKQLIRTDRKLGGICTDAGETQFGIQTSQGRPGQKGNRTYTWFTIRFEARTQFTA